MSEYIKDGIYTLNEAEVSAESINKHGPLAISAAEAGLCFGFVAPLNGNKYGYDEDIKKNYPLAAGLQYQDLSMYNPVKPEESQEDGADGAAPDGGSGAGKDDNAIDVTILLAENEALRAECAALKADTVSYQAVLKEYDEYANIIAIIRQSNEKRIADIIKSSEEKIKEAAEESERLLNRLNKIKSLISGE